MQLHKRRQGNKLPRAQQTRHTRHRPSVASGPLSALTTPRFCLLHRARGTSPLADCLCAAPQSTHSLSHAPETMHTPLTPASREGRATLSLTASLPADARTSTSMHTCMPQVCGQSRRAPKSRQLRRTPAPSLTTMVAAGSSSSPRHAALRYCHHPECRRLQQHPRSLPSHAQRRRRITHRHICCRCRAAARLLRDAHDSHIEHARRVALFRRHASPLRPGALGHRQHRHEDR